MYNFKKTVSFTDLYSIVSVSCFWFNKQRWHTSVKHGTIASDYVGNDIRNASFRWHGLVLLLLDKIYVHAAVFWFTQRI